MLSKLFVGLHGLIGVYQLGVVLSERHEIGRLSMPSFSLTLVASALAEREMTLSTCVLVNRIDEIRNI